MTRCVCSACGHVFAHGDVLETVRGLACPNCRAARFTCSPDGAGGEAVVDYDDGLWTPRCQPCAWTGTAEGRMDTTERAARIHNSEQHLQVPRPEWAEVARWAAEQAQVGAR
ncbi:hypothetical protein ACR8AH_14245 [Clavibacter sepedonicus]